MKICYFMLTIEGGGKKIVLSKIIIYIFVLSRKRSIKWTAMKNV